LRKNPRAVFIASLGTISYDLKSLQKKENIIYVPGAMGCATSIGLGYALNSKKKVIVIIGDGSALMKLGSFATVRNYKPKNLEIHVIKNDKYASTGGQRIYPGDILSDVMSGVNGRTYQVS